MRIRNISGAEDPLTSGKFQCWLHVEFEEDHAPSRGDNYSWSLQVATTAVDIAVEQICTARQSRHRLWKTGRSASLIRSEARLWVLRLCRP